MIPLRKMTNLHLLGDFVKKNSMNSSTRFLSTQPDMSAFKGKNVFITGASRGIGLAMAKRLAQDGANIIIASTTTEPNPKLPGTIYTAAQEIGEVGGNALPIFCDIRSEKSVDDAIDQALYNYDGIDILINNASIISLSSTANTSMRTFDHLNQVNTRGTFLVSKKCLPYLAKSKNPHILNISPPLNMSPKWFHNHLVYTMTKYGMSMCVLGMSKEFADLGIAVNALWPKTTIATSAIENIAGGDKIVKRSRNAQIMAEAAYYILQQPSKTCNGNFYLDQEVLENNGITDFSKYSVTPDIKQKDLFRDLFL